MTSSLNTSPTPIEPALAQGVSGGARGGAPPKVWLAYGDAIRVVGILAVMLGHVCDMALFRGYGYVRDSTGHVLPITDTQWWACNFLDAASRFAVPLFVMLSGALLLDVSGKQSPREFYLRRFNRVGVPLIFWSIFYTLFVAFDHNRGPREAVLDLVKGNPYGHMHFVFRIVGLYAFTPMFRVFLRHADRWMVVTVTVLALALGAGDSVARGLLGATDNAFTRFVPFIGYYFLGFLIKDVTVSRKGLVWCWIGYLTTAAIVAVGAWYLARNYGIRQPYFADGYVTFNADRLKEVEGLTPYPSIGMLLFDFLSPPRVLMAACVFLIFRNTLNKPWPKNAFFRFVTNHLGPATLGMYLIHPAFRAALGTLGINALGVYAPWAPEFLQTLWVGIPLTTLLLFVPSVAVTLLLRSIPGVRWIVG